MSAITNACSLKQRSARRAALGGLVGFLLVGHASAALAAPCPTDLPNPVYGAGGSAVTATLGAVATALAALPESERVTIFYWDPGACVGYHAFVDKDTGSGLATPPAYFKYWDAAGNLTQCEATGAEVLSFAHMGNTPALCPAKQPLPAGFGRFTAPVQTVNVITHPKSEFDSISAEAFYHVYGFGPGAAGRSVAPWSVPEGVFGRATNSFVHQMLATAFRVPPTAFKVPEANVVSTNQLTVQGVFAWGESNDPNQPLGYVSGSAADDGEDKGQSKTLAVQYFDQTCGYLPDSSRTRKDKLNVRNGQYALFTPGQFYAKVDGANAIANAQVEKLVRWFDGTLPAPGGLDIVKIIIQSGDIPLCAMRANRPDGDLNPIVSYAPPAPCNGYFEFTATGSTSLASCTDDDQCKTGAGEKCRFGFCELY
ncbi:MAG: hypothetical protein KIS78_25315 [Labilithrix sp.]|nr:hypothetical protein [Labilithrix sp.]MCW5835745.1 hypothetical protein [Labilithrix sp.]